jgi:hypothetical protein
MHSLRAVRPLAIHSSPAVIAIAFANSRLRISLRTNGAALRDALRPALRTRFTIYEPHCHL